MGKFVFCLSIFSAGGGTGKLKQGERSNVTLCKWVRARKGENVDEEANKMKRSICKLYKVAVSN